MSKFDIAFYKMKYTLDIIEPGIFGGNLQAVNYNSVITKHKTAE